MAVVVTLADVGLEQLVFFGDGLDRRQGVGFALPGPRSRTLVPLILSGSRWR
ncbi:hypothetical protein QNM99_02575 [Pseudomonas sp. PCH446]